jgi:hypothetical protein
MNQGCSDRVQKSDQRIVVGRLISEKITSLNPLLHEKMRVIFERLRKDQGFDCRKFVIETDFDRAECRLMTVIEDENLPYECSLLTNGRRGKYT